jgi:hypothetical protein
VGCRPAATAANPGDVFEIAAGMYAPFTITRRGTAGAPIALCGPASAVAVVDGANTSGGVITIGSIATGGRHVIIERLTIHNGLCSVDADSTSDITIRSGDPRAARRVRRDDQLSDAANRMRRSPGDADRRSIQRVSSPHWACSQRSPVPRRRSSATTAPAVGCCTSDKPEGEPGTGDRVGASSTEPVTLAPGRVRHVIVAPTRLPRRAPSARPVSAAATDRGAAGGR